MAKKSEELLTTRYLIFKINGAKLATTHKIGGVEAGFAFGAGYGRFDAPSKAADLLGKILQRIFPGKEINIRCNSDGLSCGAHYEPEPSGPFGIGPFVRLSDTLINRKDHYYHKKAKIPLGTLAYSAAFSFNSRNFNLIKKIPHWYISDFHENDPFPEIESPIFRTALQAVSWLKKWGPKYSQLMKK